MFQAAAERPFFRKAEQAVCRWAAKVRSERPTRPFGGRSRASWNMGTFHLRPGRGPNAEETLRRRGEVPSREDDEGVPDPDRDDRGEDGEVACVG